MYKVMNSFADVASDPIYRTREEAIDVLCESGFEGIVIYGSRMVAKVTPVTSGVHIQEFNYD